MKNATLEKPGAMQQPRKKKRRLTRLGGALLIIALLLVAARLYLPVWVLHYVNRKINETPDYSGSIENVDLHLWRGAYVIRNITIYKSNGKVPVPFFTAPAIDLSVQWKALLHGAFVGNIEFEKPKMNFVKGPDLERSQVGVDQPWTDQIKKLFPLKINRFHVDEGEIHYRDLYSNPKIDLALSDVYMTCTNITNSDKLSKTEVATLEAEGKPLRDGTVKVNVSFDPYQTDPTFDLKAEIAHVPLVKLNEMTQAYAYFTFKAGTFAGATELKAGGGRFNGYVKPVFDHMQILSLKDVKNPVKFLWEGLLESIGRLLRNQPKDRFATEVPLSGDLHKPKEGVMVAIGNVFKNAFIQVFNAKVEGAPINVNQATEKQAPAD